jgi:hypothetical protein
MDVVASLTDALEAHGEQLPQFGWPSETGRWMELLICLVHQMRPSGDIQEVRRALSIWRELGLVGPGALTSVTKGGEDEIVLQFVLKRHGFGEGEALDAVRMVVSAASAVVTRYGGKLQRCLRAHAEAARDELATAFAEVGVPLERLRFALTHWLQNTTNAPLSLEHESVVAFCTGHGISMQELRKAADDLDLNLSQLDDLLDLRAQHQASEAR